MPGNWNEIKTAPKDGRFVELWLTEEAAEHYGCEIAIMCYQKRPLLGDTWTDPMWGWSCDIEAATHWRDLPTGPE